MINAVSSAGRHKGSRRPPSLRTVAAWEGTGAPAAAGFGADRDTGPRLCRGCGGQLMPSTTATAVFCSLGYRSRHWCRLRRTRARTEAVQAAGTANCAECGMSWTVGVEPSLLGTVLLSPLPQTGKVPAVQGRGRGVRPRVTPSRNRAPRSGVCAPAGGRRQAAGGHRARWRSAARPAPDTASPERAYVSAGHRQSGVVR